MTKKDYIIIAEALKSCRTGMATDEMLRGVDHAVESLAVALARDNPKFAKAHFVAVVRGEKALLSRP